MSFIRPYLVILLLAVLMFHTIVPVSASSPPVRPGDVVTTQPDKDGGAGHPTEGQGWGEGTPSGGFYVISDENTPDTLIPLGPGVRLIVIFRGGTADGKPCLVFGRGQSLPPIIHCTME
jgi:hypothetical protein